MLPEPPPLCPSCHSRLRLNSSKKFTPNERIGKKSEYKLYEHYYFCPVERKWVSQSKAVYGEIAHYPGYNGNGGSMLHDRHRFIMRRKNGHVETLVCGICTNEVCGRACPNHGTKCLGYGRIN